MRLIGSLKGEKQGLHFSSFLHQKGIKHQLEIQPNTDWGSDEYGSHLCRVWIDDEDQVEEAMKWYQLFNKDPDDPLFYHDQTFFPDHPPFKPAVNKSAFPHETASPAIQHKKPIAWDKQPMGWMTRGFLILCCGLFFATYFIKPPLNQPADIPSLTLLISPIDKVLLYDYPQFHELIDRFISTYGYEGLENTADLSPSALFLLQKINHTPYWQGLYSLVLEGEEPSHANSFSQAPLFEKIREGQVWRLFSPALLHGDIFHLFFNMLWLIVLGKQIEQRQSAGRMLLFIFALGIFSNTAQYLMGGSNFVGFSGILCGMLAFIWVRQKIAPWEGYQVDRMTFLFIFIFIGGMALLQFLSFFIDKFFQLGLSPRIANTAHLAGAAIGYIFGKINFFRWREV